MSEAMVQQIISSLKNIARPVRSRLRAARAALRIETSRQRFEERAAALRFWRSPAVLEHRLLFTYKFKDLSDHLLYAMLIAMRQYRNIDYLGFSRAEKPRDNPQQAAAKFMRGVQRTHPEAIFAYASPLSTEEMQFVKRLGIPIATNIIGLGSFFFGGARSQAEAMELLRSYDWYYVSHAPHVGRLAAEGVNAFYLPMGYEPRWFHPLDNITPRFDILFVGDVHTPLNSNRRDLLEHVSRYFRVAAVSYKPTRIDGVEHLPAEVNPYRLNRLLNQARIVLSSDRVGNIAALNQHPGQYIFYDDEFYLRQRTIPFWALAAATWWAASEIARQFDDGRRSSCGMTMPSCVSTSTPT
jgi:hypothetical protein